MRAVLATEADVVALTRACDAESLVVEVVAGRDPLALALVRAAIGPLAAERAPRRVNALVPAGDADRRDVDAAARFLENARSTTGQVIEVAGR